MLAIFSPSQQKRVNYFQNIELICRHPYYKTVNKLFPYILFFSRPSSDDFANDISKGSDDMPKRNDLPSSPDRPQDEGTINRSSDPGAANKPAHPPDSLAGKVKSLVDTFVDYAKNSEM